jgi:uncharacterized membrane protein
MASWERSLKKAVSYRVWATIVTMLCAVAFTGNFIIGIAVGIADTILKTVIYVIHDYWYDWATPKKPETESNVSPHV